jgi:hypothetical protein
MTLEEILDKYHKEIVQQWANRLHTQISERYPARPIDELYRTTSEVAEANCAMLVYDDFSRIDSIIEMKRVEMEKRRVQWIL